jgi:hypothetical protein
LEGRFTVTHQQFDDDAWLEIAKRAQSVLNRSVLLSGLTSTTFVPHCGHQAPGIG